MFGWSAWIEGMIFYIAAVAGLSVLSVLAMRMLT
jgi:hypothetical protein